MWLWLGRCLAETPTEAGAALERAIELYRRLDDRTGLGISLVRMSRSLAMRGRFQEAEANIAEAGPLLESAGAQALNQYHFNAGSVKNRMGDRAAARKQFERALALARELDDELGLLAATGNVANAMMGLGDVDGAITATRDLLALIRSSSSRTPRLLGTALMNLAGFFLEKNDLDAALPLAREGLPLVVADGSALFFSHHGAFRAGRQGKFAKAALLCGYADRVYAENGAKPDSFTVPMRERLLAQLGESLPPDELARLFAEGAKLSEDEAWRMALEK
jgi:tetratricopeptide (TPR) repeat protein